MSIPTLLPFIVLVVLVAAVVWILAKPRRPSDVDADIEAVDREREALLGRFYDQASRGEPIREVARIYSQTDVAAIEALMASEGVAILPRNTGMNVLRTGAPVRGLNDCVFVVLQKDYERAVRILQDYLEELRMNEEAVHPATAVRNIAETLVAGAFVNPTAGRPEIL